MSLFPHERSGVIPYVLTVIAVAMVVLASKVLPFFAESVPPLMWFTCAVVFAAWRGGFGPGLLATVLCGLAAYLGFFALRGGAHAATSGDFLRLFAFVVTGLAVSGIAEALHRAIRREREKADALRTSEERLRLAVQATEDAVWDWDIASGDVGWSPAVADRYRWPQPAPSTGPSWWQERIHPEDRERVVQSIRAAVADPACLHWETEYRFRRGDDTYAEVLDRGSVKRDEMGRAVRMVGAMLDLTERKQTEVVARQSREQLQVIIDTVPSLISYVDRNYTYRWNSRGYEDWFKRPLSEITGHSMQEVLGDEAFALVRPYLDRALAGEPTEYEEFLPYTGLEGRWVHAIYAPHRAHDGAVDGVVVSVTDVSESRRAELSQASLAAIVESSDDAIVGNTLEGIVTSWNRAAERLFGYTAAEMIGQPIARILPADRLGEEEEILSRILRGEEFQHHESVRCTKDGRLIDVALTTSPVHSRNGTIVGAAKIARDITDRKRAQQALRESEHRWHELAEAMPHLVWTCLPDGYCDFLSNQWLAYTGRPEREQLGGGWTEAVHPADRDRVRAAWQQAVTSKSVFDIEFRIRRYDGEYRWFKTRAVPVRDEAGAVIKWYGSNTDIEELKRAEAAALQAAEQRLLAVEAAGMGAWNWNLQSGVLTWSDRAFELFGVSPGDPPTYDRFVQAVHPEDRPRVEAALREALARPPHKYQCEYRVLRPDGSVRWLFGKGAAQPDPVSGELLRMIGITVDVTDRVLGARELTSALDSAEAANRAKDAFLAALSHELRTPLTPVLFLAATLERSPEVPEELRSDFAMIRRNIELEARLIDDLLDLTRITRGKLHLDFAPTDLHAVVERSLELLREEIETKRLALHIELCAARDRASGDAVRLQQVFWNVLKNAVKFTPKQGSITVRSECGEPNAWHLAITDTGLGITAEELPHIFDAFAQGREASSHRFGGLGLGLAISSLLMKEHGGRIWAESAGRDRGATFHIELPLQVEEAESPLAPDTTVTEPVSSSGRLLIVEDHEPTRQTLHRLLTRRGYDVEIAETAERARALARKEKFDLMISDLGLPDGSGHELASEFARDYQLRSIALSGYGMEDDVRRSQVAGFLDHITKPVDIEALHDAIRRALEPASVSESSSSSSS